MIRYPEDLGKVEGVPEEKEINDTTPIRPQKTKGSLVPVIQLFICTLILLALAVLKFTRQPQYERFTQWYRTETEKVIVLPSLQSEEIPAGETTPQPSPSPSPTPGSNMQRV